jgi:putative proteasome-type protease
METGFFMTYCVGMMLDRGLVLMSDTRTNSGVDNISVFRKMFCWSQPGMRIVSILTAGNLATTQAVISQLEERTKAPAERHNWLLEADSMFQVASTVGSLLRDTIKASSSVNGEHATDTFGAAMIVAGQLAGKEPRLFLVYPEGNFIEASFDTPFFQIGETKYGRPIIIRAYDRGMSFEAAIKLLMLSFDSTLKANLSVGMPLDLMVIARDEFVPCHERRIEQDDPYFQTFSAGWGEALREAFDSLPVYDMADPQRTAAG